MTLRSQLAQLDCNMDSLVCRPAVREPRSRGTLRQGGIIIRLLQRRVAVYLLRKFV